NCLIRLLTLTMGEIWGAVGDGFTIGSGTSLHGRFLLRIDGSHAVALLSALLGRVFRGALCLQAFGMKDAVVPEAAVGESLRIVLKRVRRSFGSGVDDWQSIALLDE